jgi:hypothetical protein
MDIYDNLLCGTLDPLSIAATDIHIFTGSRSKWLGVCTLNETGAKVYEKEKLTSMDNEQFESVPKGCFSRLTIELKVCLTAWKEKDMYVDFWCECSSVDSVMRRTCQSLRIHH